MTPEEIRGRREALGLSRTQLAQRLGVTYQTIYLWEAGRRVVSMPTMLRLALAQIEQDINEEEKYETLPRHSGSEASSPHPLRQLWARSRQGV